MEPVTDEGGAQWSCCAPFFLIITRGAGIRALQKSQHRDLTFSLSLDFSSDRKARALSAFDDLIHVGRRNAYGSRELSLRLPCLFEILIECHHA